MPDESSPPVVLRPGHPPRHRLHQHDQVEVGAVEGQPPPGREIENDRTPGVAVAGQEGLVPRSIWLNRARDASSASGSPQNIRSPSTMPRIRVRAGPLRRSGCCRPRGRSARVPAGVRCRAGRPRPGTGAGSGRVAPAAARRTARHPRARRRPCRGTPPTTSIPVRAADSRRRRLSPGAKPRPWHPVRCVAGPERRRRDARPGTARRHRSTRSSGGSRGAPRSDRLRRAGPGERGAGRRRPGRTSPRYARGRVRSPAPARPGPAPP